MSEGDRLTRQELAWLLTQEARSAASTLRKGVASLAHPPEISVAESPTQVVLPPLPPAPPAGSDVVTSLDTLDDAMKMLASLYGGTGARGRRGRIDLAALLCELAPQARVHIEPGSGTEVLGDEAELKRMMQVLLARSSGVQSSHAENPEVSIERAGNEVRVSVALGPDTIGTPGAEHAWLNRMAMRYGGRLELEGGKDSLVFPAEGATEKSEVEALRKELEEAQRQGEAYARELAAVFAAGGETTPVAPSTVPPSASSLSPLMAVAAAISAELKTSIARMIPSIEQVGQRGVDHAQLARELSRRTDRLQELSAALQLFGRVSADELPAHLNASSVLIDVKSEFQAMFERRDQKVTIEAPERADAVMRPSAFKTMVYALLRHASDATPNGGSICAALEASEREVVLTIDDAGASVPSGARDALLWRRIDPASVGRPVGPELLFAGAIASHLNGWLDLDDAPGGGNRTRVRLPVL